MLPPLRDRAEDTLALAELFAARFAKGRTRLSTSVAAILTLYRWPGNVRELRNAMERAALLSVGGTIMPEHLPRRVREATAMPQAGPGLEDGEDGRMKRVERAVIMQTLADTPTTVPKPHRFWVSVGGL